jgi:hypothetical protein
MAKADVATSGSPFERAYLALRAVSLVLQFAHKGARSGPYRCPLEPDTEFNRVFASTTLRELEELGKRTVTERWEKSGRFAMKATPPPDGSKDWPRRYLRWEAEFAFVQRRKRRAGRTPSESRRDRIVDSIFEMHRTTLAAIDRYLPLDRRQPIARAGARLWIRHDYLWMYLASVWDLQRRVLRLAHAIETARRRSIGDQTSQTTPVTKTGRRLCGWREILSALEIQFSYPACRRIRRLNTLQSGPIKSMGRGRHPEVLQGDLLTWWHDQEGRLAKLHEKHASRKAMVADAKPWGRHNVRTFDDQHLVERKRRSDHGKSKPRKV